MVSRVSGVSGVSGASGTWVSSNPEMHMVAGWMHGVAGWMHGVAGALGEVGAHHHRRVS